MLSIFLFHPFKEIFSQNDFSSPTPLYVPNGYHDNIIGEKNLIEITESDISVSIGSQ